MDIMKKIIIDEKRDFKGVWISKELYCDPNLNCREVFLLAEIQSLCELGECFASNKHFANYLGISKREVEKLILNLREKGYIETEVVYKNNSREIAKRIIRENTPIVKKFDTPTEKNDDTPTVKKCGDKNTSNKNTKEE